MEERKGMLAAVGMYMIFGLSFLFSKNALNDVTPALLLCARFSITFAVLCMLVLFRIIRVNMKKNLLKPVCLGLLQPVLYFIFENYGLNYTTTSFTGLVASISPIFSAILGALLLKERPSLKQWLFILFSIAGVMIISFTTMTGDGRNTLGGCVCLVLAYLFGALYTLLSRHLSKDYQPFELTFVMFAVGFAVFTLLAFVENGKQTLPLLANAFSSGSFIVSIFYLSILSSIVAFALSNYALARLPVARVSVFSSLSTIISVLSGIIVMRDPFSLTSFVGCVVILVGVWGVNRYK